MSYYFTFLDLPRTAYNVTLSCSYTLSTPYLRALSTLYLAPTPHLAPTPTYSTCHAMSKGQNRRLFVPHAVTVCFPILVSVRYFWFAYGVVASLLLQGYDRTRT